MTRPIVIASVMSAALTGTAAARTVLFVDEHATDPPDGQSWCTAYRTVYEALDAAAGATLILVAEGTYLPDPSGLGDPRDATFALRDGVTIQGGYAGCGAPDPNERDISLYETILSGDIGVAGDPADNCYHVVTAWKIGGLALMDGFTVTAGHADGPVPEGPNCGGGLYAIDASPTLIDITFAGNTASAAAAPGASAFAYGGGVFNDGGSPVLIRCTARENVAAASAGNMADVAEAAGGGMYDSGVSAWLVQCAFVDNTVQGGGGEPQAKGGGLYAAGGAPLLSSCTFRANLATVTLLGEALGGGMCSEDGDAILVNCTFRANTVAAPDFELSPSANGGGLANRNGSPTLVNCAFTANVATDGAVDPVSSAGGVYSDGGSPVLADCLFLENSAKLAGGGLHAIGEATVLDCLFVLNAADHRGGGAQISSGGADALVIDCLFVGNSARSGSDLASGGGLRVADAGPTIVDCLFIGNLSAYGGGVCNSGGTPTIVNCTLFANDAMNDIFDGHGGGIIDQSGGSTTVRNTILWANTADVDPQISGTPDATYNCVQGGWPGTGNIAANPLLVGGPAGTWTAAPTYDPAETVTTFSDSAAAWTPGGLVGLFLNPDTTQHLQSLIVANTATSVTVWGDLTGMGGVGTAYQVQDLHISAGSPCIDAGHNWALPVDGSDFDQDGKTCELFPLDLDGLPRFVDDPATPDTGCGVPVIVDMGAYEFQQAGTPAEVVHADMDGNGVVDVLDMLQVLAAWGPATGCTLSDRDMSTQVDVLDLLAVIAAWGPC